MDIYVLGPFRLDTANGVLLHGNEPTALGRRAVALLRALVEKPGVLVSKDALIEAAWPGQAVEESNLPVQIAALRRVLASTPGGERWIETMPRRGYRFVGPVATGEQNSTTAAPPQLAAPPNAELIGPSDGDGRQISAPSRELVDVGAGADETGLEDVRETVGAFQPLPRKSLTASPGVVGLSSAWLPRRQSFLCALRGSSGRLGITSPQWESRRRKQLGQQCRPLQCGPRPRSLRRSSRHAGRSSCCPLPTLATTLISNISPTESRRI